IVAADESTIAALIKQLSSKDHKEQTSAIAALSEIGRPAIPALIKVVREQQPAARGPVLIEPRGGAALEALRKMGDDAIPALVELLDDKDNNVRVAATAGLCGRGSDKIILDALTKAGSDTDERVRGQAVLGLVLLGDSARPAKS